LSAQHFALLLGGVGWLFFLAGIEPLVLDLQLKGFARAKG
jgi:hypothetical protein